ncbi:hypothetical protein JKP88DRAFT_349615 [Tribonema minus]|uniref:EGF-like domain-containing protein n=1 Tax=Tribonema minus TaxID=303371 RepID=A0A835Z128_9STRA|nr:hypothetical protein JKP88DRAFT_349615 [Tribonema minus]
MSFVHRYTEAECRVEARTLTARLNDESQNYFEFPSDAYLSCAIKNPKTDLCILRPAQDPCSPNPCKNGATCGVSYIADSTRCKRPVAQCRCAEVGSYVGATCARGCAANRAACGRSFSGYNGNSFTVNDKCCRPSEACLVVPGKYDDWRTECIPKVRPASCAPNPCKNGGTCDVVDYYGDRSIYTCDCAAGWTGSFSAATCGTGTKVTVQQKFGAGTCSLNVCCPRGLTAQQCKDGAKQFALDLTTNDENCYQFPSDVDVSCNVKDPSKSFCLLHPSPDPCSPNPCKHGARCTLSYTADSQGCHGAQVQCHCAEIGNYAGKLCGVTCAPDTAPCGRAYYDYDSNGFKTNDRCCKPSEACVRAPGKYGWFTVCVPKARPLSCDPNPCKNGGSCDTIDYYGDSNVHVCSCTSGWTGALCSTPNRPRV